MRTTPTKNKNNHLEAAMALLITNQAAFLGRATESDRELTRLRRETDKRFARIESLLTDHSRILGEHTRLLQAISGLPEAIRQLPEAIRQKIGFKSRN